MPKPRTVVVSLILFALGALFPEFRDIFKEQPGGQRKKSVAGAAEGQVVAVMDGDTIGVMVSGQEVRVRLVGIDAPEKAQPFGMTAKEAMSDAVFGKVVHLRTHSTDRYGRTLADVYQGKTWINLQMIRSGFAWHYSAYSKDPQLAQAEQAARRERRGLWSGGNPMPPWNWRAAGRQTAKAGSAAK